MRVVIVGAGGHGQVVADALLKSGSPVVPIGYLDDDPSLQGQTLLGLPVIGLVDAISSIARDAVVIAVGANTRREELTRLLEDAGEQVTVAIHPSVQIGAETTIARGSMLCAGAALNAACYIGRGVIVNTCASVDHHSFVDDFAHIAPGAHMGGNVTVGRGALVGIGATVLPGIKIGRYATVGAGAVVTRDVADHACVVGVPAHPVNAGAAL